MRDALIRATDAAIRLVDNPRFFATERGFHGRFYCALQGLLDQEGMLDDGRVLEMEYQKSAKHGLAQRPDIVLHIPAEPGASVKDNNLAVWALKFRARKSEAIDDFCKLDEMFCHLHYPVGFFLNIGSDDPMLQHYDGEFRARILAVAIKLESDKVMLNWFPE